MSGKVTHRATRRALALVILALLLGASAEAASTVAAGVTNGLFNAQNPFDRNSQRKVVRDSSGACFVVFTQTADPALAALNGDVTSGRHQRIGDAILAAQKTYAQTGAFPELLSLYHLFGDPALSTW